MPYVKVMIHAVWGTKNRELMIHNKIRPVVLNHIKENAMSKGIHIIEINSQPEHVHCLFKLRADMALSKALNLIKGESSFWINKKRIIKSYFEWADEYYASSVSESHLSRVSNYIINQDEHHGRVSFTDECDEYLKSNGFDI